MPRKGENIYKRKDGRWEGRYIKARSSTGKAQYGYVYAQTYKEAKCKLAKAMSDIPVNAPPPTSQNEKVTFGEMAAIWLIHISPQVKESSFNKYQNILDSYLLPIIGDTPLTAMTHSYIDTQCNSLLQTGGKHGTGLSPKTVSDTLSIVRRILGYAIQLEQIVPCDGRSVVIKRTTKTMRVFTRNEQEVLSNYLLSHLNFCNLGILISLFTGLRVGEVCALRWGDISLQEQTIYVHQTMQRVQDKSSIGKKTKIVITTPKSQCSIRLIPLPVELVRIISIYQPMGTGFLLTNSDTNYIEPRTLQNRFKRVQIECNIDPMNFHTLRHTFATRCVELGFDIKSLSEILGHATVNITMNRYVHPSMELKKENMSRLSDLFAVK